MLVCLALVALFLVMFVIAEQLRLPLLTDSPTLADGAAWPAALLGVALLVADVVLPVPSSGVMVAQGAAFGFVAGAILSLVGGTGATLAAYYLGRRSRRLINRLVSPEEQRRGAQLLETHGMWAIVATRPVPMLAEAVAILAGVGTGMPWWKVVAAGALGNVLPAVAYAAVGAYAATFVNGLVVFAGVCVLALLAWVLPRLWRALLASSRLEAKRCGS